jgi:hypothetical protein
MFMPIDLETGSYARHDISRALPASRQAAATVVTVSLPRSARPDSGSWRPYVMVDSTKSQKIRQLAAELCSCL